MDHPESPHLAAPAAPAATRAPAKFVQGSTMRHVIVMTATATLGLMAIFVVDLLNLFYIARLGETHLTAAVGYASTVLFMTTSVCIGLMIATSALVSRALGSGDLPLARRLAASSTVWMMIAAIVVTFIAVPLTGPVLDLLGATGETRAVAARFLYIAQPTLPLMALGLAFSGVLRAVGDARRAMYVTLSGGIVAAIMDPILIFGLGLGVDGAALSILFSRLALAVLGWHGAVRIHNLVARPTVDAVRADAGAVIGIAGPAVLTNLATPVANGYMTAVLSPFGDGAIAANAVIGRLVPVCFGVIFALSGAVGPILGQNYGARKLDRVRQTMNDAFLVTLVYVCAMWALLALSRNAIIAAFGITDPMAADLVIFFCLLVAGSWIFHGFLFVANAAFNNLGYPVTSTLFNWGKATVGTMPFAYVGALHGGATGAFLGQGVGAVVFGVIGMAWAYRTIARLKVPAERA